MNDHKQPSPVPFGVSDHSSNRAALFQQNAEKWTRLLTRYADSDPKRSAFELAVTAIPFALLWVAVLLCVQRGWWAGLLLTIPAAGFLVRLFLIQHDCGHGSFFRSRATNDALGRALGVLTFTPYSYWRKTHAIHHGTTGNLDRRGLGDVDLLTVAEYRSLPRRQRLVYRATRNPFTLLGIGPFYLFVLKYRLPVGLMHDGLKPWVSTMGTNFALVALVLAAGYWIGFWTLLAVQLPITLMAGAIGIWLFYVQHQFEQTYWARTHGWSYQESALLGSTHYELPLVLSWLTANIGIHHIHHLSSQIPCYRLGEPLAAHPEIQAGERLDLRSSLRCFRYALWDEERERLVGFRDLARS